MSVKSMMPVGYRFHPTDQELINHYLRLKNQGSDRHVSNIQEIDVCKWEPWELPGRLGSESDDQEWYFFGRRDSKNGKSTRSNRATKEGYWKPTGKDRYIKTSSRKVIGTKKTLVFYKGRAQRAVRTNWVMHEYRASVDKYNPQAFVLYLLKKKSEENTEISNSDGTDPIRSSALSSSFLNTATPFNSPSTPSVHQGSGNLSSSDQTHISQNWKEQEVSSHAQNYPLESAFPEDDDGIDMQAFESCFDGQNPTWEGLERMLPAIPLADVYPNQGPIHLTARYLNVMNKDHEVTQFQNIKRREEAANDFGNGSSMFVPTPESGPLDAESGTETDNDVPQSLFEEDAVYGGSAYLSDSESSDKEFYNDTKPANEVQVSAKTSRVIPDAEHESGNEDDKKPFVLEKVHESALSTPISRKNSDIMSNKPLNNLREKTLETASEDRTVDPLTEEKSSELPEVAQNEASRTLGFVDKNNHSAGYIVYAENPRVKKGTSPPTNYVMNVAIGIFLTVAIMGEVLFFRLVT